MLPAGDFAQLVETCRSLGEAAAEPTGFVPVRNLLSLFRSELLVRPLLVEGMIGTVDAGAGSGAKYKWAVLIDSETHAIDPEAVAAETAARPLPVRFRNTVAHELVHSLAFRPSEFGVRLQREATDRVPRSEVVESIERETERLSPLLLAPETHVIDFFSTRAEPPSAGEIHQLRRAMGISRPVLVNRLKLLSRQTLSSLVPKPGFRNWLVGVGEWIEDGSAVLRSWPIFHHFERNLVPEMFWKVRNQDRLHAQVAFPNWDLVLTGGASSSAQFITAVGTEAVPQTDHTMVEVSVESSARRPGASFLYVVRRKDG